MGRGRVGRGEDPETETTTMFKQIDDQPVNQGATAPVEAPAFELEGWMVKARAGRQGVEVVVEDTTTSPANMDETKVVRLFASWSDLAGVETHRMPGLIRSEVVRTLDRLGLRDGSLSLPQ